MARGWGGNLAATFATESLNLGYTGAYTQSDNYKAGDHFKDFTFTGRAGHTLPLGEVGSSAFESSNQSVRLAWRTGVHLLELSYGVQDIPYEGYANQRMDMTDNRSDQFNLAYTGSLGWERCRRVPTTSTSGTRWILVMTGASGTAQVHRLPGQAEIPRSTVHRVRRSPAPRW